MKISNTSTEISKIFVSIDDANSEILSMDNREIITVITQGLRGPMPDTPHTSRYNYNETNADIDVSLGSTFKLTLQANANITISGYANNSQRTTIYIAQDHAGNHAITSWPVSIRWNDNTAPVLNASPLGLTRVTLDCIDGDVIYGNFIIV